MRARPTVITLDGPVGRLYVRVAATIGSRARGLLFTCRLPVDQGLLILPCRSIHTMGMRYPIDAIFVDGQARIVDLRTGLPPWRSACSVGAHAVLEVAAGVSEAMGFRPGTALDKLLPVLANR